MKPLFDNSTFQVYPDCMMFGEEYTFTLEQLLELIEFLVVNGGPSGT